MITPSPIRTRINNIFSRHIYLFIVTLSLIIAVESQILGILK